MYPLIEFDRYGSGSKFLVAIDGIGGADDEVGRVCLSLKDGRLIPVAGTLADVDRKIREAIHWRHEREVVAQAQIAQMMANARAGGIAIARGNLNGA